MNLHGLKRAGHSFLKYQYQTAMGQHYELHFIRLVFNTIKLVSTQALSALKCKPQQKFLTSLIFLLL